MTNPDPRPTLVFGIVAATGTHIDPFVDVFSTLLRKYGYEPASISSWERATAEARVPSEATSTDLERRAIEALSPAIKGLL